MTYLPLSVFPGPVDEIDWEDFHTQTPLNAVHHDVKAFAVPDDEAGMIQFIRHLFEVQVGVLRQTIAKGEHLLVLKSFTFSAVLDFELYIFYSDVVETVSET